MGLNLQFHSPHRYAGDLGDGLHLLDAADADLWDPEGAADVRPLLAALGGLHGAAAVGAELALGLRAERAGAAEPLAGRDVRDAVARLVHADVALVAEHHLVVLLGVRLKKRGLQNRAQETGVVLPNVLGT